MSVLLPTFFIIGAAKAGTTSLHAYLAEHPEIAMTTIKEPAVFERDDWRECLSAYDKLFDRPAQVRGEASTAYSAYPWAPDVPDRVRDVVPDAKLVYLVRDPVDRAVSHFIQNRYDGHQPRSWDDIIRDVDDPLNAVVACSRYATQVRRWIEPFGEQPILVVDHRDLLVDRATTLREVLRFLDVDPAYAGPRWTREHNPTTGRRELRPWASRLGVPTLAAASRPFSWLVSRRHEVPPITTEQRAALAAMFAPEAATFRRMTGRAFADWCV